ncbi:hypothetical protein GobsT_21500 [Gemmata obscuriglobus]|uniref:Uncharacterized protein n=1 Tax=Gemmata obscuriglobus TaxID=114 RepID=A0A2Z3H7G0_9BACT|nr:hypothetical protein [Gemmata obscuriglobus]AWM39516.1 hypothetical protein C1280_22645 [Gemmata obscuriglobus]QEG27394.1 hypothetical protein GobsT_21500 [Gemmata obscuriglobus]VTS04303.1 Uncharacterized protein OS=Ktedonobacter racemifer DSM 44963 GN=Krac_5558 PE=4 SV=1 [Gemmata obscuriglobus UQM 2246]
MATIDDLYSSLARRLRPEDVAELVRQELGAALSSAESTILDRAARGAHTRGGWAYSSMSTEFQKPVGLANQVRTARDLFPTLAAPAGAACDEPAALAPYIAAASGTIAKAPGASDFKQHRLNRSDRTAAGLGELSKRQYNKRFRLLGRMEAKLVTLEREIRKREYTLVAKSRLASRITRADFVADRDSACFIAYLTARANLRSVFTNGPQERPYDEIADMLFARCRRSPAAHWWAVAHVHPVREVLDRLTDEQKGRFLAVWFDLLAGIAELLRSVWEKSRFDRATMIVKRGDDSTTWNAIAGAWNKARESWIAVLHALDMNALLDRLCPGKVLRLMAADVAYWHRASGGGLEPDTAVWAALPAPWEVLGGTASCTRAEVEAVCVRCGVDPVAKGWTAPRPGRTVEAFRPTPELVHGVAVGHPGLAALLRKVGVFSGKTLKLPAS